MPLIHIELICWQKLEVHQQHHHHLKKLNLTGKVVVHEQLLRRGSGCVYDGWYSSNTHVDISGCGCGCVWCINIARLHLSKDDLITLFLRHCTRQHQQEYVHRFVSSAAPWLIKNSVDVGVGVSVGVDVGVGVGVPFSLFCTTASLRTCPTMTSSSSSCGTGYVSASRNMYTAS